MNDPHRKSSDGSQAAPAAPVGPSNAPAATEPEGGQGAAASHALAGPAVRAVQGPRRNATATPRDELMVVGRSADGEGYNVLRRREDTVQLGQVRALREGAPIHGEVVRLKPRAEDNPVYDVEVLVQAPGGRKGPAKVTSEPYRRGWDAIFGSGATGLPDEPPTQLN